MSRLENSQIGTDFEGVPMEDAMERSLEDVRERLFAVLRSRFGFDLSMEAEAVRKSRLTMDDFEGRAISASLSDRQLSELVYTTAAVIAAVAANGRRFASSANFIGMGKKRRGNNRS